MKKARPQKKSSPSKGNGMAKRIRTDGRFEIDRGQYGKVFMDTRALKAIKLNPVNEQSPGPSPGLCTSTFNEWNASAMIAKKRSWHPEDERLSANLAAAERTTLALTLDYVASWMPFYESGSLHRAIHKDWKLKFAKALGQEKRAVAAEGCEALRGLVRGLRALESLDLLHRDVKVTNVLLNKGEGVVIDLGMIANRSVDPEKMWTSPAALSYKPPELLSGETTHYGREVDVWAVGATAFEVFTMGQLFVDHERMDLDLNAKVSFEAQAANLIDERLGLTRAEFAKYFPFAEYFPKDGDASSDRYYDRPVVATYTHRDPACYHMCEFLKQCLRPDAEARGKVTYEELECLLDQIINELKRPIEA